MYINADHDFSNQAFSSRIDDDKIATITMKSHPLLQYKLLFIAYKCLDKYVDRTKNLYVFPKNVANWWAYLSLMRQ